MIFDHYDEVLAEVITAYRNELAMSRADVAEAMGITESKVTSWESMKVRLPTTDFMRLAMAFGTHPSEMMRRVERELLEDADTNSYQQPPSSRRQARHDR